MKLTEKAIEAIKLDLKCRNRLAYEMNTHSATVDRWLEKNKNDGPLTTSTALRIISEETGIKESELLVAVEA